MEMPYIERTIQVSYRHQVHFTEAAFDPENSLLRDVMIDGSQKRRHKVLVILDEALATSRPNLARNIEIYFAAYAKNFGPSPRRSSSKAANAPKTPTSTSPKSIPKSIATTSTAIPTSSALAAAPFSTWSASRLLLPIAASA